MVAHANYCDPFELGNDVHWCIPNVWTLRVSDYLSQLQANRSPPFKWHWCQKKERRIGLGVELCIPSLNTFALFAPSRFLRSCGVSLDPLMRFGGSRWLWEWPFLGTKSFPCIHQFWHLVYHIVNFVVWMSRSRALWWRSQCAHFATSQLHPMPTFKSSKFYGRVISPLFRFKDSRSPWYDWILQNYRRKYLAICVWMLASHMPSCEYVVRRNRFWVFSRTWPSWSCIHSKHFAWVFEMVYTILCQAHLKEVGPTQNWETLTLQNLTNRLKLVFNIT